jgi:hypothetical protein
MDILQAILSKLSKTYIAIFMLVCAVLVTLSVVGILKSDNFFEQKADQLIKSQTGIDLELVEKDLLGKS